MKHLTYGTEEETEALLTPDRRSIAQKTLKSLLTVRGADEQGAEHYKILYEIAIELIEGRMK